MINNSVLSNVRNKLYNLGFREFIDLSLKEVGGNCLVFDFCEDGKMYEVRYYEENKHHLIGNYLELGKYGITPFNYTVEKDIVVYENDMFYKELSFSDLNDEGIVHNLAEFFKRLHEIDFEGKDVECYFNGDNILKIINSFNLQNNECLAYLYNNSKNIELKIKRLKTCLLCGGFSLEHLMILEGGKKIYLKDLDGLKRGNRCLDLHVIFDLLKGNNREKFLEIYGNVSLDEIVLSKVERVVRELFLACQEKNFPSWAESSLLLIESKSFLLDVKCLVEWY